MRARHGTGDRCVWLWCVSLAAMGMAISVQARPLHVEEVAKLTLPDASWNCCGDVEIDGNILLVTASRPGAPPEDGIDQAAFVFERNASGQWQYVTELVESNQHPAAHVTDISVALEGTIAAVALGPVYYFQRTGSGWVSLPSSASAPNSTDSEASNGRWLVSDGGCGFDARLFQNQTGEYAQTNYFRGFDRGECDDEFTGRDIAIHGNLAALSGPEVYLFTNTSGNNWTRQLILPPPAPQFVGAPLEVALRSGTLLIGASQDYGGPHIFLPPYQQSSGNLVRPDALNAGRFGRVDYANGIVAVVSGEDPGRNEESGSIAIFTTSDNRNFTYAARLVKKQASSDGFGVADVSGRTIAAAARGSIYVFQLPASLSVPAILQDDFEDGSASDWTPIAGSAFSVVSNGRTRVYRQSTLAGAAGSSPTVMDWKDQSIQADVKPTAFDGADRWFGLTLRQTDSGNYYYLTMRSSNSVQIKKLVNGTISTLATASFPVTLNRTYNLRLEVVGSWLRAFVDGKQVLKVRDQSHKHGRAGLYTYKTRADFDNVIITPSPQSALFQDTFDNRGILDPFWKPQTGTWALANEGTTVVVEQSSIAGGSRMVVGVPTDDQIIRMRAKATSFATTTERWFGLVARFVDDQNYYYVTARNTNTVSLRKLVNGVITVLDTAPMQVRPNVWYDFRLEAVGNSLRLYTNGQLTLEANDSSHPKGIYGMAASKAAVRYDDVSIIEP
jgi:hypothetical protein